MTIHPAKYTEPSLWLPLFLREPTASSLQLELIDSWIDRYDDLSADERDNLRLITFSILRISDLGYSRYKTLHAHDPQRMDEQLIAFLENPERIRTIRSKINVALVCPEKVIMKLNWNSLEAQPDAWRDAQKKGAHFSNAWENLDTWQNIKTSIPRHVWETAMVKLIKSWAKQDCSNMSLLKKDEWIRAGEKLMNIDDLDWDSILMNGQANMRAIFPIIEKAGKSQWLLKSLDNETVASHSIGQFWSIYDVASNKKELLYKWGIKLSKDQKGLLTKIASLPTKKDIDEVLKHLNIAEEVFIEKTIHTNALSQTGYQEFMFEHSNVLYDMFKKGQQHIPSRSARYTLPNVVTQAFDWINQVQLPDLKNMLKTPTFAVPIAAYLSATSYFLRADTWTKHIAVKTLLNVLDEDERKECLEFFVKNISLATKVSTQQTEQMVPWYWLNMICKKQGLDFPSLETINNLATCFNLPFLDICINTFEQLQQSKHVESELSLEP